MGKTNRSAQQYHSKFKQEAKKYWSEFLEKRKRRPSVEDINDFLVKYEPDINSYAHARMPANKSVVNHSDRYFIKRAMRKYMSCYVLYIVGYRQEFNENPPYNEVEKQKKEGTFDPTKRNPLLQKVNGDTGEKK